MNAAALSCVDVTSCDRKKYGKREDGRLERWTEAAMQSAVAGKFVAVFAHAIPVP